MPYDGRKYIWLTSTGRDKGASSGSPVAFFGNLKAETVCVTEGPLKGLLAHQMTGLSFLCVPGVSQYKNLRKELIDCKIKGWRNNIRKGCQHLYEICRELNLPVVRQM